MKLAQIMAGAENGGAELFYERLSLALHAAGDTIIPVIRHNPARTARLTAAGLSPHALPFGGPFDRATRPALARLLRAEHPAVTISWMSRAANLTPRGPWVTIGRLGGHYDLKNFATCDHLVGNTQALADWLIQQGTPPARAHYLPNFVPDLAGEHPADKPSLNVPADVPLLLALGRLHPAKGFDTLIRALPAHPTAHLIIAGEGSERKALARLAASLRIADRVHLPGWRTDTAALLAACDLFVCSSRHEPLGNMVLEAFSAAKPVLATATAGPAALIRNLIDGLLVPPDDPAALAQGITSLLRNPAQAQSFAQSGRARYLSRFTEARVVAEWRGFLAQVAR